MTERGQLSMFPAELVAPPTSRKVVRRSLDPKSRKGTKKRDRDLKPANVRRCAWCTRQLKRSTRIDAVTCSQECRQKRARAERRKQTRNKQGVAQSSQSVIAHATAHARIISRSAIERAGLPVLDGCPVHACVQLTASLCDRAACPRREAEPS